MNVGSTSTVQALSSNYPKNLTPLSLFTGNASMKNDVNVAITATGDLVFRGNTTAANQAYTVGGCWLAND